MFGVDFHFLFFALIFLAAQPSLWALAILFRRSLWSVGTHWDKNPPGPWLWRKFSSQWEKLKAKQKEVLYYSTMAEILLAFWLTASLFLPTRQIFTCILYWNYVKTRYQMPRSHEMHEKAWTELGQKVQPILQKLPILQKPIDLAKGWFVGPGGPS